jgi:DNA invertase Pin-like site-specific DNA recombinase
VAKSTASPSKASSWRLIRDPYDDGGYSGGTMERPALQRLLEVVGAGRIESYAGKWVMTA